MTEEQKEQKQDTSGGQANKDLKTNEAKAKNPEETQSKAAKKTAQRKKAHKGNGGGTAWLIVVVLLALIGGGAWYGYQFYLQTNQALKDVQRSQSALTESNQGFEQDLSQKIQNVSRQMQSLENKQQQVSDYVDVLREKNRYLRKDWLLMESEYLIQLANHRLLFERDINTSIVALESADQRLRETGDPGVVSVRKAIAQAVQQLKQIPQADLAGLSLQLSAINNEIEKLPLSTIDPISKQDQQMDSGRKVESWSELPAAVWKDLKSLVVIRDHEKPIEPMLSPKERFFLVENVRLQIEQARLAMLSGQNEVYKERMTTAINWISAHFDNEAQITQTMLASLKNLLQESIAPELPDIAYTYQSLKKYRLSLEKPPLQKIQPQPQPQPEPATPTEQPSQDQ